ncbi:MAG: ABC transporter permease [Bacteriovoracaceae bacterium]|nr:ABC transporter permease [Bacteroidota bacterium]
MNKILTVATWEFIEKVRTKAFFIGLIMTPMILAIFIVIPNLLADKEDEKTKVFGVIDMTNSLTGLINSRLLEKYTIEKGVPNYQLKEIKDENKDTEHLKILATTQLASGDIEGYFILPANVLEQGKIEYRAENVGNARDQNRFSNILEEIIIERRLQANGYDAASVKKLMTDVDIKTFKVSKHGDEKESGFMETFFTGYIFIMMLMFLVLSSGQMLIRSIIEEKANRIVEVLISSCSAQELMSGKIIGLSMLGLTTVAFWVLILVGVNFTTPVPFVTVDNLMLLILYFILGYFMYVGIFIIAGSTVSTEQEAQQMTGYITIILVLPIAFAVPVMFNPDSLLVKIMSQIPLLTPTMMALRLSIQTPAWWEIVLSLVLLPLTIYSLMWVAGKVFRIGILVTGKKPSIKEIYRWLKEE